jgi:hypothetical protein
LARAAGFDWRGVGEIAGRRTRRPVFPEIENLNMNEKLAELVSHIVSMLVAGRYADLEQQTHGVRLTANEMAEAIADYGRTLVLPPRDGFRLMNVVEIKNAQPKRWSVAMPLWTKEEGRSDLTVEMTISEHENVFLIELDDIHVL